MARRPRRDAFALFRDLKPLYLILSRIQTQRPSSSMLYTSGTGLISPNHWDLCVHTYFNPNFPTAHSTLFSYHSLLYDQSCLPESPNNTSPISLPPAGCGPHPRLVWKGARGDPRRRGPPHAAHWTGRQPGPGGRAPARQIHTDGQRRVWEAGRV